MPHLYNYVYVCVGVEYVEYTVCIQLYMHQGGPCGGRPLTAVCVCVYMCVCMCVCVFVCMCVCVCVKEATWEPPWCYMALSSPHNLTKTANKPPDDGRLWISAPLISVTITV